jgi:mannitol/fructose-specific phosphotransferase system IIA component (Ntr-type)
METIITSAVVIAVGLLLYWFYGRIRSNREYALLHLIERLTAKELTDHGLETELKEIIHERDEVSKDKFDHLIEDSLVLDIEEAVDLETCFRKASEAFKERIKHNSDEIYTALVEREKISPTVLSPYMAIPHIILEKHGESVFDVLLVRCKDGIKWSDEYPAVHAVFVLAGTADERHFHLITRAPLAQIVLDPKFDAQGMAAKTEKNLRDVILLGKRKR